MPYWPAIVLIMDPSASANAKHVFMEETKENARNVVIVFIKGTGTPVLTVMAQVIQSVNLLYCM